jgi:hypothetical protein
MRPSVEIGLPVMLPLTLLPSRLAVCRLDPQAPFPAWVRGELVALTRTADELSVVCDADVVPPGVLAESGWRAFKVLGPLDFALVGVLAQLSAVLAQAGVSIFAISTYDTDYILVKEANLDDALAALRRAGYSFP